MLPRLHGQVNGRKLHRAWSAYSKRDRGNQEKLRSFSSCKASINGNASKLPKLRLDELCIQQYPEIQPNVLRSWIAQGKVKVGNKIVSQGGTRFPVTTGVQLLAVQEQYVCRAGKKLEAAIQEFSIDVRGKHALDCGISTGGFTDCLLQHGADSVIGIDVGYGQVAEKIRQNPRLRIMERTNIRHLQLADLPHQKKVDLVTLDLSFISILKVIPQVKTLMAEHGELITLIKPQFEAEKHQVQEGGVIKDSVIHQEVCEKVKQGLSQHGFTCAGLIESPVKGAVSGNKEFLAYFQQV